jgi:hypothetical protein
VNFIGHEVNKVLVWNTNSDEGINEKATGSENKSCKSSAAAKSLRCSFSSANAAATTAGGKSNSFLNDDTCPREIFKQIDLSLD